MEIALVLALAAAVVLGGAVAVLWRRGRPSPSTAWAGPGEAANQETVRSELFDVIKQLPGPTVVVDSSLSVLFASEEAVRIGLVRRGALGFEEIAEVARQAGEQGAVIVRAMNVRRPPLRKGVIELRVRALRLTSGDVLLLLEDLTEARRVDDVRRDFIANVSHELKTPVGAISLLAEAIMSASDDREAVEHFAQRMLIESRRLANLVNDLIDLSRLQGGNPMSTAAPLQVDDVVAEAVDHVRAAAEARSIEIITGGTRGLEVLGTADQLVTAVRNLLSNAIAYSPENTRVAVAVRRKDAMVEIAVKDQGIGIEEEEQGRIFERFYRVDGARSRVTGGTGLGLAIVRNVCRNHGGDATVWSVVGEGSTFTIQLPLYQAELDEEPTSRPPHVAEGSNR